MKDLMRKDKLLLMAFVFSCVMMYISSPDNLELRELVWDFSFMVAAAAVAGWVIVEILDFLGSIVLGNGGPKKLNVEGLSREGLITMAENAGLASRKTLNAMSDEDIISLIANMNGAEISKGSYGKNLLIAVIDFWIGVLKKFWNWLKRVYTNIKAKLYGKKGKKRTAGSRR